MIFLKLFLILSVFNYYNKIKNYYYYEDNKFINCENSTMVKGLFSGGNLIFTIHMK